MWPTPSASGRRGVGTTFRYNLFWLGRNPLVPGKRYRLKLATTRVGVHVKEIVQVLDAATLEHNESDALKGHVGRHEVAECVLETQNPIAFDLGLGAEFAATGRFVLVDKYEIAGGGIVTEYVSGLKASLREHVKQRDYAWVRCAITALVGGDRAQYGAGLAADVVARDQHPGAWWRRCVTLFRWRANRCCFRDRRWPTTRFRTHYVAIDKGLREAHIGHVLSHSNVVHVHQADVIFVNNRDRVVIAMDYMPNGPIANLANPRGFLPLPAAIRFATDILRGLEYLHGHGFLHNDVKPGNVLVGPQNQGMLTDYGIVGVATNGGTVAQLLSTRSMPHLR